MMIHFLHRDGAVSRGWISGYLCCLRSLSVLCLVQSSSKRAPENSPFSFNHFPSGLKLFIALLFVLHTVLF